MNVKKMNIISLYQREGSKGFTKPVVTTENIRIDGRKNGKLTYHLILKNMELNRSGYALLF